MRIVKNKKRIKYENHKIVSLNNNENCVLEIKNLFLSMIIYKHLDDFHNLKVIYDFWLLKKIFNCIMDVALVLYKITELVKTWKYDRLECFELTRVLWASLIILKEEKFEKNDE